LSEATNVLAHLKKWTIEKERGYIYRKGKEK
jgi:hypothetical protein